MEIKQPLPDLSYRNREYLKPEISVTELGNRPVFTASPDYNVNGTGNTDNYGYVGGTEF